MQSITNDYALYYIPYKSVHLISKYISILKCLPFVNVYMCSREPEQSLTKRLQLLSGVLCLLEVSLKATVSSLKKTIRNSHYYPCLSNQCYRIKPAKFISVFFILIKFT